MIWALVIITASIWDGRPNGTQLVGYFDSKIECEVEAGRLGLIGREQTKYSCSMRYADEKKM